MLSKTPKMPPNCHLRSYHHLSIDFRPISYGFSTNFPSIFDDVRQISGVFLSIFAMHFCIQFFNRFLMVSSMFSLSMIQMCYSAETLKKLISQWFLQCFVRVAFFRTRQSKHQVFAESIKLTPVILIENSSENQ